MGKTVLGLLGAGLLAGSPAFAASFAVGEMQIRIEQLGTITDETAPIVIQAQTGTPSFFREGGGQFNVSATSDSDPRDPPFVEIQLVAEASAVGPSGQASASVTGSGLMVFINNEDTDRTVDLLVSYFLRANGGMDVFDGSEAHETVLQVEMGGFAGAEEFFIVNNVFNPVEKIVSAIFQTELIVPARTFFEPDVPISGSMTAFFSAGMSAVAFSTVPPPPIQVIPLPAAGWLLLGALGGLAALCRRQRGA